MLSAGHRLGPYVIVAPLGAGSMGEVYRAQDTRLDRIVAVKVLSRAINEREDIQQRFVQGRLSSEQCVRLIAILTPTLGE